MNELHLFAGAGGGILGGHLLGHRCVCAVEIEEYPRRVLIQRQLDGILPKFPIWDDICTFDAKPWRGVVDVVAGGFPCQDISSANYRAEGIDGERSGLWGEMLRVVCEVQPRFVFVENSPALTSRGLGRVLGDLASVGYDAEWCVLGAREVGGKIKRDRLWVLACPNENRLKGRVLEDGPKVAECKLEEPTALNVGYRGFENELPTPRILRKPNDLANTVDRLAAIGNGQVPAVAAAAFDLLRRRLNV